MVSMPKSVRLMTFSSSANSVTPIFVIDASVVINLNASRHAPKIIQATKWKWIISANAHDELRLGAEKGHADFKALEELIAAGLIETRPLGEAALADYDSLVGGPAGKTLDDGEAATLALAIQLRATALIDERKARTLAAARFPALPILSTAAILTSERVQAALGEHHRSAILGALRGARMRVPEDSLAEIIGIVGEEQAALCPSLPPSARPRRAIA